MKLLIILAATVSAPALAQHAGHSTSPEPAPEPQADPHAGHKMPAQPQPVAPMAADPHAGHVMPPEPQPVAPPADPHAGHVVPARPQPVAPVTVDPHAGHAKPAVPTSPVSPPVTPHAGHDMGAMGYDPPVVPPPPAAFVGPKFAADIFWNDLAMARAREELLEEHGDIETYRLLIDQLEARLRNGRDGYAWEGLAWYGGDINKLWIETEGEGAFGGSVESAEVRALWSRAINPWFDAQLGVRYDFRPDPERAYLVAAIQGLAPYWFEVDGQLFLSETGDVSARFEAEYEFRITQKLILQPQAEIELALQDVPELGVGSGLSTAELGARLRYEFYPERGPAVVAPYLGLHYERAFGDTARYYRDSGEDAGGWNFLVGFRTWF